MKIIWKDGFDRDHVDDVLVADNIRSIRLGQIMLTALLQDSERDQGSNWYTLVEDDYELHKWEE